MHTQTELCVILEERVSPRGTLTLGISAIRSRRSRARVDRSTTRSVCNHHLIAEELGNSLDIGSLTATCTRARELEQWLCKLQVLYRLGLVDNLLVTDLLGAVLPILCLCHLRLKRTHNERLLLRGTDIDAVTATRTIERRYLHTELESLGLAQALLPLKTRSCSLLLGCEERTDSCVRTYVGTLVALDTVVNLPLGNIHSDTALLPRSCTVIPSAILAALECRNGEIIALQGIDRINNVAYELRTRHIYICSCSLNLDRSPLCGNLDLLDCVATCVNRSVVHIDDILALLAVGLRDSLLHLLNSLVERDYVCNLEECRLHNSICTRAETELCSNLCSVDNIEVNLVLCEVCLHRIGQCCASSCSIVYRVQKERAALLQTLQYVILVDIRGNVASHKVGSGYQVG